MKLWLLRPIDKDPLWDPWYDKAFGFVVRAKTEEEARELAQSEGGYEINIWKHGKHGKAAAWTDPAHSTCVILSAAGQPGVVIRDFAAA